MKKQLLLLLLGACALTITGCKKDDPNKIKISCVSLGYGTEWLQVLMKEYTKKTGIGFNYTEVVGQAGNNNLDDQLKSLSGTSDIYGCRPGSFHNLLYRGHVEAKGSIYEHAFEPLTDIYNAEYEGESGNNTMLKKMDPSFSSYVEMDGDYYGVPWANGFVSFVRNLDVWTKFFPAESYPRTTEELFEMMDTMNITIAGDKSLANVSPMIFCSQDEYYTTIMGSWFAQYEGDKQMQKFYAGRDPQGKRSPKMFTYDGVSEALKVLGRIVEYDKNTKKYKYQSSNSDKLSFTQMQNYFLNGSAAFCVNGTWLEVENPQAREANLDYIKIPLVSSIVNKLSKSYTEAQLREMVSFVDAHVNEGDNTGLPEGVEVADIEIVRGSRNTGSYMRTDYDHLFVIPAWSTKKEKAKDFLKWMYSDEALQLFYNTMNGHHLPATLSTGDYDSSNVTLSKFRVSCNKVFSEGNYCKYLVNTEKDKIFSVANVQSNFSNTLNKTGNCCHWLIDGMTPDQIVEENTKYLTDRWSSILNSLDKED